MKDRLPESFFYEKDTLTLAQALIGCELMHKSPEGVCGGVIVETEAYTSGDPACHAFLKKTPRNEAMFGVAGTLYVYQIYGMYHFVNVVSGKEGVGEAVLIRALQPTVGTDLMYLRRQLHPKKGLPVLRSRALTDKDLCSGPGKLVQAMGINKGSHNFSSLLSGPLFILPATSEDFKISTSGRIGITRGIDLPYRFFIQGSPYVSK